MQETYKLHTLEDNHKYIEIDNLIENDIEYLLLTQDTNQSNICIRKIVFENNSQYYQVLSTNEFNKIYEKFIEKNKNLFE